MTALPPAPRLATLRALSSAHRRGTKSCRPPPLLACSSNTGVAVVALPARVPHSPALRDSSSSGCADTSGGSTPPGYTSDHM
eukprot:354314-Chlamydomonas_euryale.AAC.9